MEYLKFFDEFINEKDDFCLSDKIRISFIKEEIIDDIINDRFEKILKELNFNIQDYTYFKYKDKYIMKIAFA